MEDKNIKDVVIYCRVSTKEQTTENQKRILAEYAERRGWKYKIVEEVGSTRGTRPRKQALLQALRKKMYDAVIVYKLDRWARSLSELIGNVQELTDKGVAFISYTDNIDMSTASGKLLVGILASLAEFERDLISERVRAGLARKKAEGIKLGRPKGSKDKKYRRKSGYHLRWAGKKTPHENEGEFTPMKQGEVNKHVFLNTIRSNEDECQHDWKPHNSHNGYYCSKCGKEIN